MRVMRISNWLADFGKFKKKVTYFEDSYGQDLRFGDRDTL